MQRYCALMAVAALLCSTSAWAQGETRERMSTAPTAESVTLTVLVHQVSNEGKASYVPVNVQVSSRKLASVKADTREKQIAYVTRILQKNADKLSVVTDGFRHSEDVRFYLDVSYDPGSDAHIHFGDNVEAKKICGRICCKNPDGKQCCAIIICPGNCEC